MTQIDLQVERIVKRIGKQAYKHRLWPSINSPLQEDMVAVTVGDDKNTNIHTFLFKFSFNFFISIIMITDIESILWIIAN